MNPLHLVSYFFAGIFLVNAIPHCVSGLMGRSFPTPFAKPPGKGLSSSTVNFVWGAFNTGVSYVLIRVGTFEWRSNADVLALAAGGLLLGVPLARYFGNFTEAGPEH